MKTGGTKLCRLEAIHTVHIRALQEAPIHHHVHLRVHHRIHLHTVHLRAAVSETMEAGGAVTPDHRRHPTGRREQGPISRPDTVRPEEARVHFSDAIHMIMCIIPHPGQIPIPESIIPRAITMRMASTMIR